MHPIRIRFVDENGTELLGGEGTVQFGEPPAGVTEVEAGAVLVFDVPLPRPGHTPSRSPSTASVAIRVPLTAGYPAGVVSSPVPSPMTLDRDPNALALMHEYTASDALRKHMYAVELAMRAMAERAGEDPDRWGLVGLVHDFDYERFPNAAHSATEEHPAEGCGSSPRAGCPEPMQRAILGHADLQRRAARHRRWRRALFAVDELCGFLVACALVRPSRSLAGSRGLQRQEEAQGQGLRPGRQPRGRLRRAPRSWASRSTSTSRLCSRPSGRTSASLGLGARDRAGASRSAPTQSSRGSAHQSRGRRTARSRATRSSSLFDGPAAYEAMLDADRRAPNAGSISRTTSSGATPTGRRFAEALAPARARRASGCGCCTTGSARWTLGAALARSCAAPGSRSAPSSRLACCDLVTNLSRDHRKLVVADGSRRGHRRALHRLRVDRRRRTRPAALA